MKSTKNKKNSLVPAKKTDRNVEKIQQRIAQRQSGVVASTRKPLVEKETIWSQFLFWGGAVLLFVGVTILF